MTLLMGKKSENLGVPLYSAQQVSKMDEQAQTHGINGFELMKQAGEAAFAVLLNEYAHVRNLLVLCGAGNNGGDGFVIARLAHEHGLEVHVASLVEPKQLKGSAALAATDAIQAGVKITLLNDFMWPDEDLSTSSLVVDALLGTGLERNVEGALARVIQELNLQPCPVFAVDVPSGLNATSGAIMGVAVKADLTLTMIAYKQGLFTGQGPHCCGDVRLATLSVPKTIRQKETSTHLLNWSVMRTSPWFAGRSLHAHKGQFGHVLIVGGDHGYGGAAMLAAMSALRSGAGLVSVATRSEHIPAILARCPEVMVRAVESGQDLLPLLNQADVVVLGPGLGQKAWGQQLFQQVMAFDQPLLLDADGLNLLAQNAIKYNLNQRVSILTPHPGEAARLLGSTSADVNQDRFTAVKRLSEEFNSTVVLKGAGSLVCSQQQVSVCNQGNPGMATAGTGDVLSGICGSLLAQGREWLPHDVHAIAVSGVCLHGAAGDEAAKQGQVSMLASDVIDGLRSLLN